LDGLIDDAEADRVEPMSTQKLGVGSVEPDRARVVGRPLVDHVDAVQDHRAALGVCDPRAGCLEGRLRARARRDGGAGDEGNEGGEGEERSEANGAFQTHMVWNAPTALDRAHGAAASASVVIPSVLAVARPRATSTSSAS